MEAAHMKVSRYSTHDEHTEAHIESILALHQCRICLQSQTDSQHTLFSPCDCTGSLKYVHHTCLQSWITKMVNQTSKKIDSEKAYISCELCHGRISFDVKKQSRCKNREEIRDGIKANLKTLIALILLLLVNVSFFLAILDYLIKYGFETLHKNSQVLVSLLLSGQVIFFLVALITIVAIVRKFFLNFEYVVLNILPRQLPKGSKSRK